MGRVGWEMRVGGPTRPGTPLLDDAGRLRTSILSIDFWLCLLICIVFIGSPIETAVNLFGFTFQGYPLPNIPILQINHCH